MVTTPKRKITYTYREYLCTPEDKRYELINGELLLSPSPKTAHQRLAVKLGATMHFFVEDAGLGEIFFAPFDVYFNETNVVQPDIIFVSGERALIVNDDNIRGAPDLVVEILSPSTANRDRVLKRALYAEHGVREFWIADTDAKTISVFLLGDAGFDLAAIYGEGQTLTSPTLSGFSVGLDDIF